MFSLQVQPKICTKKTPAKPASSSTTLSRSTPATSRKTPAAKTPDGKPKGASAPTKSECNTKPASSRSTPSRALGEKESSERSTRTSFRLAPDKTTQTKPDLDAPDRPAATRFSSRFTPDQPVETKQDKETLDCTTATRSSSRLVQSVEPKLDKETHVEAIRTSSRLSSDENMNSALGKESAEPPAAAGGLSKSDPDDFTQSAERREVRLELTRLSSTESSQGEDSADQTASRLAPDKPTDSKLEKETGEEDTTESKQVKEPAEQPAATRTLSRLAPEKPTGPKPDQEAGKVAAATRSRRSASGGSLAEQSTEKETPAQTKGEVGTKNDSNLQRVLNIKAN